MAKFFTFIGFFSWIACTATISPVAFFILRSMRTKYQKRDFAKVSLGAKILILYRVGWGSFSDGRCRPITMYSVMRPMVLLRVSVVQSLELTTHLD